MALQPPTAQDAEPQSIEPTQASTPECTATEIPFEHEERLKREFNEFSEKSRAMSKSEANDATEPAVEWLEGTKLFMVIISLIFGVFLMLLDTSIIATVSLLKPPGKWKIFKNFAFTSGVLISVSVLTLLDNRLFRVSRRSSMHWTMLAGTVPRINLLGMSSAYR